MHLKCRLYGHKIENNYCLYCDQPAMSLIEILFKYRSLIKEKKTRDAVIFLQAIPPEVRLAIVESVNDEGRFITGAGKIFTSFCNRSSSPNESA